MDKKEIIELYAEQSNEEVVMRGKLTVKDTTFISYAIGYLMVQRASVGLKMMEKSTDEELKEFGEPAVLSTITAVILDCCDALKDVPTEYYEGLVETSQELCRAVSTGRYEDYYNLIDDDVKRIHDSIIAIKKIERDDNNGK